MTSRSSERPAVFYLLFCTTDWFVSRFSCTEKQKTPSLTTE